MKLLLVSIAALCLVGCSSSSKFAGKWEEMPAAEAPAPTAGRTVLRIDDDGTFAGGVREGKKTCVNADVGWQLTGTWTKLSDTQISLVRSDGEIDTAKLVSPRELLVQSPGTEMITFERR